MDLKTHDVKCTKCSTVINDVSLKNCPVCLAKDNLEIPLIRYTPGPYTMKFRKSIGKITSRTSKNSKQKNDS